MSGKPDKPTGDSANRWKDKNFKHFTDPISKILRNAYALVPWELRDDLVLNGARGGSSVVYVEEEKNDGGKGNDPSYHKYVSIKPVIDYFIDKIEEKVEGEVANDL